MHEVEVKLRLGDQDVAPTLRQQGATPTGTERQVDTYFRHPVRDFAATDEALRLRVVAGTFELTYKGPRDGGPVKRRIEHNIPLGADPSTLLESLGFERGPQVAKIRQHWQWRDVALAIDEVDGLGRFLEVEVVGDDPDAAARTVEDAVEALGLGDLERVAASYLELQDAL